MFFSNSVKRAVICAAFLYVEFFSLDVAVLSVCFLKTVFPNQRSIHVFR